MGLGRSRDAGAVVQVRAESHFLGMDPHNGARADPFNSSYLPGIGTKDRKDTWGICAPRKRLT